MTGPTHPLMSDHLAYGHRMAAERDMTRARKFKRENSTQVNSVSNKHVGPAPGPGSYHGVLGLSVPTVLSAHDWLFQQLVLEVR
jgi:hypothetical protein